MYAYVQQLSWALDITCCTVAVLGQCGEFHSFLNIKTDKNHVYYV